MASFDCRLTIATTVQTARNTAMTTATYTDVPTRLPNATPARSPQATTLRRAVAVRTSQQIRNPHIPITKAAKWCGTQSADPHQDVISLLFHHSMSGNTDPKWYAYHVGKRSRPVTAVNATARRLRRHSSV